MRAQEKVEWKTSQSMIHAAGIITTTVEGSLKHCIYLHLRPPIFIMLTGSKQTILHCIQHFEIIIVPVT